MVHRGGDAVCEGRRPVCTGPARRALPKTRNRWQGSDAAAERHGHEIHGPQTGTRSKAVPPHREAETRETVAGTASSRTTGPLPTPWAITSGSKGRTLALVSHRTTHWNVGSTFVLKRHYGSGLASEELGAGFLVFFLSLTHYLTSSSVNRRARPKSHGTRGWWFDGIPKENVPGGVYIAQHR